jgi:hypothetical protein
MTHSGTERKSAGKMPAVLKTGEESKAAGVRSSAAKADVHCARAARLKPCPDEDHEPKEKSRQAAGVTKLIAKRETLDIPIEGIQGVVGGDHGAM